MSTLDTLVRASNPQPPVEILSSTPAPSIHSGYISKQTSTAPNTTNLYTKYSKKQHSTPTQHTCTQNRAEAKQQKNNTEAEQQNKRVETKLTQF
jgi:hypothetical protein